MHAGGQIGQTVNTHTSTSSNVEQTYETVGLCDQRREEKGRGGIGACDTMWGATGDRAGSERPWPCTCDPAGWLRRDIIHWYHTTMILVTRESERESVCARERKGQQYHAEVWCVREREREDDTLHCPGVLDWTAIRAPHMPCSAAHW